MKHPRWSDEHNIYQSSSIKTKTHFRPNLLGGNQFLP